MQNTISLSKQLGYYKEYQKKLVGITGKSNATSIISGSVYLLSSGSSDFVQNYYVNPLLYKVYTPYEFSNILIEAYSHFIQVNTTFHLYIIQVYRYLHLISNLARSNRPVSLQKINDYKGKKCTQTDKILYESNLIFFFFVGIIWIRSKKDRGVNITTNWLLTGIHYNLW